MSDEAAYDGIIHAIDRDYTIPRIEAMLDARGVAPALTAEEWADNTSARSDWSVTPYHDTPFMSWFESNHGSYLAVSQHALAALALHGQPFGFTREDVTLVRDCIGMEWDRGTRDQCDQMERRLESLAARIAALLPPEA